MGNSNSKSQSPLDVFYKDLSSADKNIITTLSTFNEAKESNNTEIDFTTKVASGDQLLQLLSERFPNKVMSNSTARYELKQHLNAYLNILSYYELFKIMPYEKYRFIKNLAKIFESIDFSPDEYQLLELYLKIQKLMLSYQNSTNDFVIARTIEEYASQMHKEKFGSKITNCFLKYIKNYTTSESDNERSGSSTIMETLFLNILNHLTCTTTSNHTAFIEDITDAVLENDTFVDSLLLMRSKPVFKDFVKFLSQLSINSGEHDITSIQQTLIKQGMFLEFLLKSISDDPNSYNDEQRTYFTLLDLFFYNSQDVACIIEKMLTSAHRHILEYGRAVSQSSDQSPSSKLPSHHSYYWRELIDLLSTNEDITEIDVIFSKANRNEFLTTLRNKVREIEEQQRNSPTGSIDRVDFHIDYNEINDLLVHGIYLNQYMTKSSTETVTLNDPDDFLDGLFDICMLDNKLSNKLMILKVIHSIYKQNSRVSRLSRHIKYLIWLLSEQSMDRYIDIQYVTLEIFQTLFKDTSDANFPLYVDEKCFKSIMHIYTTILHRAYTKNMQAHQQVLTSTSFDVSNYNSKVISVLSTFILHQSTNLNESTSSDLSSISDSQRDPISVDLGHRARHNLSLTRSLPEEKEEAYSASIAKSIFNMNSDDLFSLYSIKAPTVDCIDFLELILDVISKSIIYSNTYKFIIQTDYMSLLLQTFLYPINTSICNSALSIIYTVVSSYESECCKLYKSGIFEILLYYSLTNENGMSKIVAHIIDQLYLIQDFQFYRSILPGSVIQTLYTENEIESDKILIAYDKVRNMNDKNALAAFADRHSCLGLFLPKPLIIKLARFGCDEFIKLFNTTYDRKEFDAVWTREMQNELLQQLSSYIKPFIDSLSAEPFCIWKPISYTEQFKYQYTDSLVFCNDLYVNLFADDSRELPAYVDCLSFFDNLMKLLQQYIQDIQNYQNDNAKSIDLLYEEMNCILKSLYRLITLEKYNISLTEEYFTILKSVALFDITKDYNHESIIVASNCITSAIIPSQNYPNTSSNMNTVIKSGFIQFLDDFITPIVKTGYFLDFENSNSSCYTSFKRLISTLPLVTKNTYMQEITYESMHILQHYTYFILHDTEKCFVDIKRDILQSICNLLSVRKITDCFVRSGCLLAIVDTLITINNDTEEDKINQELSEKCLIFASGSEENYNELEDTCTVLTNLMTPGFVNYLHRQKLLFYLREYEVNNPILIWNSDMLTHLKQTIIENERVLFHDNQQFEWNTVEFNEKYKYINEYTNITNKITCIDVYLEEYIKDTKFIFTTPTVAEVLDGLLELFETTIKNYFSERSNLESEKLNSYYYKFDVFIKSLIGILENNPDLYSTVYKSSSIAVIISLLKDLSIEEDLAKDICTVLQYLIYEEEGCHILCQYISYFFNILEHYNGDLIKSILEILITISKTCHEILPIVMDTGLIMLFCNIVMNSTKTYSIPPEDKVQLNILAIKLIGYCLQYKTSEYDLLKYCQNVFFPFFLKNISFLDELMSCNINSTNLYNILYNNYDEPHIYWNDFTRRDLNLFIKDEVETLAKTYKEDRYNYDNSNLYDFRHIDERYRPYREVLNKQLYVSGVFLYRYFKSKNFKVNINEFFPNIVEYCNTISIESKFDEMESVNCKEHNGCINAMTTYFSTNKYVECSDLTYETSLDFIFKQFFEGYRELVDKYLMILKYILKINSTASIFEKNIDMVTSNSSDHPYYILCMFKLIILFAKENGHLKIVLNCIYDLVQNHDSILLTFIQAGLLSCLFNFIDLDNPYDEDGPAGIAVTIIKYCLSQSRMNTNINEIVNAYFIDDFKNHDNDEFYAFIMYMNDTHVSKKTEDNATRLWNQDIFQQIREKYGETWSVIEKKKYNEKVELNLGYNMNHVRYITQEYSNVPGLSDAEQEKNTSDINALDSDDDEHFSSQGTDIMPSESINVSSIDQSEQESTNKASNNSPSSHTMNPSDFSSFTN